MGLNRILNPLYDLLEKKVSMYYPSLFMSVYAIFYVKPYQYCNSIALISDIILYSLQYGKLSYYIVILLHSCNLLYILYFIRILCKLLYILIINYFKSLAYRMQLYIIKNDNKETIRRLKMSIIILATITMHVVIINEYVKNHSSWYSNLLGY